MRRSPHDLLPDPPHAEGDPAAPPDGREWDAQTPAGEGARGSQELPAGSQASEMLLVGPRGGGVRGVHAGARVLRAHRQACVPRMRQMGDTAGARQAPRGRAWAVPGALSVWTDGMSDPPQSLWGLPQTGPRQPRKEGLGSWAGALSRVPPASLTWQEPSGGPHLGLLFGGGGSAPRRPEAWSAGGYVVPDTRGPLCRLSASRVKAIPRGTRPPAARSRLSAR